MSYRRSLPVLSQAVEVCSLFDLGNKIITFWKLKKQAAIKVAITNWVQDVALSADVTRKLFGFNIHL
jgi:hypothetical protein